jgi:hypothetical protein
MSDTMNQRPFSLRGLPFPVGQSIPRADDPLAGEKVESAKLGVPARRILGRPRPGGPWCEHESE